LLYHFYAADGTVSLLVEPFRDATDRVVATRAPQRLNSIGLSVVEIDSVTDNEVTVEGIDVVNGPPLLDIKPFVPRFDVSTDMAIK
jgi:tRNA (Thr-GGU) A37 N-methylase